MFLQIFLLTMLLLLSFGCYLWTKAKKYRHLPGNLGFPVIGNLYQCLTNYWHSNHSSAVEYVDRKVDEYENENLCCFWLCHRVAVAVADPFLIQKLVYLPTVNDKPKFFYDGYLSFASNLFAYLDKDKEWKLRRKEFNDSLRKSSFHSTFTKAGNKAVQILSEETKQFDCQPKMALLTIEIITKTHFGWDISVTEDKVLFDETHTQTQLVEAAIVNPILRKLFTTFPEELTPYKRARKFILQLRERTLSKASKVIAAEDEGELPVAVTIALRNISRNTIGRELLLELVEVINVGTDTVGHALPSALVYLGTNPHVQEKVWQEQQEIFGDSEREPTAEDIGKMEYLERFFKEVLRFMGPSFSGKEALEDIEIDGKIIPKGTILIYCSRRMRFDPRYWNKPEVFDPERYLPKNIAKVPKYASAAFGYGVRSCPGSIYATYVFKVIISSIVRKLEIQSTMKFEEIKYKAGIMMEILGGYNISVKNRKLKGNGL